MIELISFRSLTPDPTNPRLPPPPSAKTRAARETIRAMVEHYGDEIYALAEDIQDMSSLHPHKAFLVWREPKTDQLIVKDGNRRLIAMQIMDVPDIIDGIASSYRLRQWRKLGPVAEPEVQCHVSSDLEFINRILLVEHGGKMEGVGHTPWNPEENARFQVQMDRPVKPPFLAREFLRARGASEDLVTGPKFHVLDRVIKNQRVREATGFDYDGGKIILRRNVEVVEANLLVVFDELMRQRKTTRHLNKAEGQHDFLDSIRTQLSGPREGLLKKPEVVTLDQVPVKKSATTKTRRGPVRARPTLVPSASAVVATDPRVKDILKELRMATLKDNRNLCSFGIRVVIELSVKAYRGEFDLPALGRRKSGVPHQGYQVLDHLLNSKRISSADKRAVEAKFNRYQDIQQWLHNPRANPTSEDLRLDWDIFEPVLAAIWNAIHEH